MEAANGAKPQTVQARLGRHSHFALHMAAVDDARP